MIWDGEIRARPDGGKVLFTEDELKDPDTGTIALDPLFVDALRTLRRNFKRPMMVTSCCRSRRYNEQIGGHPRSLHVWDDPAHAVQGTCAIDISVTSGAYALALTRSAIEHGWSVGVATNFLHLDRRTIAGLTPVVFGYGP